MKSFFTLIFVCIELIVSGQTDESTAVLKSCIFFPYPMQGHRYHSSIGFTMTAMPQDVTEEVAISAPAGDYHFIRKIKDGFYVDGRVIFQIVQNHFSLGPRWAHVINNRLSFSVGDDFAWWFGTLKVGGFNTTANGWLNYPNASFGYRFNKVLLSCQLETSFNLHYQSKVGDLKTVAKTNEYNGWSASLMLEQPFYKHKDFILGFRGQYANFLWQTWPLYETFDRHLFYPEVIVGFIL
jgi:hypothetical protein